MTETTVTLPDVRTFGATVRRTRIVRAGLAAGLLGTLLAAALLARSPRADAGLIATRSSTIVVLDFSWSTSSSYRQIARVLGGLASSGRRLGLVAFSDVAYEMFPAGTPSTELRPLLRFFARRRPASPWAASLSGGTRISAGLDLARQILDRDRITHGSVVLVSDLDDAPDDRAQLTAAVLAYLREGVPLRVVGIEPTRANAQFFGGLLGSRPLAPRAGRAPSSAPGSSAGGVSVALLAVAGAFLLLLALNEHLGAQLTWSRSPAR